MQEESKHWKVDAPFPYNDKQKSEEEAFRPFAW